MNATLDRLRDQISSRLMVALVKEDLPALTLPQLRELIAKQVEAGLANIDPADLAALSGVRRPPPAADLPSVNLQPSDAVAIAGQDPVVRAAFHPATRSRPEVVPVALVVIVVALLVLFVRSVLLLGPANSMPQAVAGPVLAPPQPVAGLVAAAANPQPLIGPDGTPVEAQRIFRGDISGQAYEISFGKVTVAGGQLKVLISGVPGSDGVFDHVRLQGADGSRLKFEAEDQTVTGGDAFSANDGLDDGHWWLQSFGAFSGGKGLVIRKNERMPVLTCALKAPDGEYELFVGSFKGDPPNGIFALGVTVR